MSSLKPKADSSLSPAGLGHLLVVYIIWSSTYLAIRIMVAPGSGFAIWTAGSIRMALAGGILLLFAALRHHRVKVSRQELLLLFVTGILLWVTGNGLVMWSEQWANSGFVALVLACTPIWSAFIESVVDRELPSGMLIGSLFLSLIGIVVLVAPSFSKGITTDLTAGIAVNLAAISWSIGSIIQKKYPFQLDATVVAGYQHLMGGIGFVLIMLVTGPALPQASNAAWLALGYLIVFGSIFGFTSFIKALQLLPINIAMTYAYVNPVLALVLGWWLLHESLTIWTLVGAVLVIVGVIGVFKDNKNKQIAEDRDKELEANKQVA